MSLKSLAASAARGTVLGCPVLAQRPAHRFYGRLGSGGPCTARFSSTVARFLPSSGTSPVGNAAAAPSLDVTEDQDYVRLPFEATSMLGLQGRRTYTDSEVNTAYDDLMRAPMEEGYSEAVLAGRRELLNAVREQVISLKGSPNKEAAAVVPMALLPSALVILVEVGRYEVVMDYGPQLLANWELRKEFKRDVMLTLALAHCGLASELLAETKQVAEGCAHMEEALQLLQAAGTPALAPGLTRDIIQGLEGLRAPRTLDELKQDLPADSAGVQARQRTVAALAGLLSSSSRGDEESPVNQEFARIALSCLASDEVVRVQNWEQVAKSADGIHWSSPDLVAMAAVAHVVTGFTQHQPSLIRTAKSMLRQLQQTPDVCIAAGVCQVLLGNVDEALKCMQAAGRADINSSMGLEVDPEVASYMARSNGSGALAVLPTPEDSLAFIEGNSPQQGDILPGLCLFVQLWLMQLAFPMYRNTAEQAPSASLMPYFEDPRVQSLLTAYEGSTDAAAVRESIDKALSQIQQALASVPVPKRVAAAPSATTKMVLLGFGAALLAGLAMAVGSRMRGDGPEQQAAGQAAVSASSSSSRPSTPGTQLKASTAESVIRRWLDAKAAALGPNHDTGMLSSVVADPLKAQTMAETKRFKQGGWFMRYKVARLKVTEVDDSTLSSSGGYATVVSTIEESANMYGVDGRLADGYSSMYDTEYRFVRGSDGGWMISSRKVLGREPSIKHP